VRSNLQEDLGMHERTNILITGASSGLGAGMAREFAAHRRHARGSSSR
jgi:NAD(P)-dependent dehydrogenase (short-subunit alcohol dehydrogenase family)